MKKLTFLLFILFLFFFNTEPSYAIVDPRQSPNNRFGIHIIDENDLEMASELINSSGGEWGYVTIVLREDDRNRGKWQNLFDRMRELKIIPLIRLATKTENGGWSKPREEDIDSWINFLDSLNWVVKNRYLILFNEPNHANEWGGQLDPAEYARMVRIFSQKLKSRSEDFFILPAGFDSSAPNTKTSLDIYTYLRQMYDSDPEVFSLLDGWTSHSYPNPRFSGSPSDSGRNSIQSYKWETDYLKRFGLKSEIPIFITETGWKHDAAGDNSGYSTQKVAEYFQDAFENIWSNENIIAITPFLLRYLEEPFKSFSWISQDSQTKHPQYERIKDLPKIKGEPAQVHKLKVFKHDIPDKLVLNSDYRFQLTFTNTGQSIWNSEEVTIEPLSSLPKESVKLGTLSITKPFEKLDVKINLRTPEAIDRYSLGFQVNYRNKPFVRIRPLELEVIPPLDLMIYANLWPKIRTEASDFSLQVYENGRMINQIAPLLFVKGKAEIIGLHDVIPHRLYRFRLIKPNYLPQDQTVSLSETKTTVKFKRLLPLDLNQDGKFNISDLAQASRHPLSAFSLLNPFQ